MGSILRMRKKLANTAKIPEIVEPIKEEEEGWDDQLEAIRYTTKVFAELDKQLGTDLILARLEPGQREFIQQQVKLAIAFKKQIPYRKTARRVFLTIISDVLIMAILNRNVEKNVLLEIIGGVRAPGDSQEASPQALPQTLGGKLKEKMMGGGGDGQETSTY